MSEPLLRAVGVRKSYGHTEVLRGIDLEVQRGQVVDHWPVASRGRNY